jgi:hypothetical protein
MGRTLRLSNTRIRKEILLIKVKLTYSLWEGKEEKQKVGREEEKGPLILKGFY